MNKSAVLGFSYFAGLIAATFLPVRVSVWLFCLFAVLGLAILLTKFKTIALALITISFAFGVYAFHQNSVVKPILSLSGSQYEVVDGEIIEYKSIGNDMAMFTIKAKIDGKTTTFTMFSSDLDSDKGDRIYFTVKLDELENNASFSQKTFYANRNIYLKGTAKSEIIIVKSLKKPISSHVNDYANYIKKTISSSLTGEEGDFLVATFLGESNALENDLKNSIKRTGLAHYLAVSGMHLSITGTILMLVLNATKLRKKRVLKFALLSITVLFFMVFYGFSLSVLRSGIMLIIFYGADFFRRRTSAVNSIGAALFLILLPSPHAVMDVGLHLSIAGTFGVAVLGNAFTARVVKRFEIKRFRSIIEILSGTFFASLCTLPILLLAFGGFSTVSLLTNLVVTPVFNLALICLILHTLTIGIFGGPLLLIAGLSAKFIIWIVRILDEIPYSYIALEQEFIPKWIALATAFVVLTACVFKKGILTFISLFLSLILLFFLIHLDNKNHVDTAYFTVLSDGKAGAIIITKADETAIFVQGNSAKLAEQLGNHLKERNITDISLLSIPQIGNAYANLYALLSQKLDCKQIVLSSEVLSGIFEFNFISKKIDKPDDFSYQGNNFLVKIVNDQTAITVNGIEILLTSVKNTPYINSDIAVYADYKRSFPEVLSRYNIFINSRQDVEGENNINAYDNEIKYKILDNSKIVERKSYAIY